MFKVMSRLSAVNSYENILLKKLASNIFVYVKQIKSFFKLKLRLIKNKFKRSTVEATKNFKCQTLTLLSGKLHTKPPSKFQRLFISKC